MKLFFDTLITLAIFMTAIPAVILLYNIKKRNTSWEARYPRRAKIIALILLCGTFLLVWGSFLEPRLIVINKQTIDIPHIEKPIKIALISDLQIGSYKQADWVELISKKITTQNPDIILIAGDNIDNAIYDEHEVEYLEPLKLLAKQYPTYAVHGNHEYGIGGGKAVNDPKYRVANFSTETKKLMESLGIRYLVNELEEVILDTQSLYIFGGDELWSKNLDYSSLQQRNKDIPTLGLIHNPSFIFDDFPEDIDLYLSGHTHGGQIRLPFIGPLGRVDHLLPADFYQGLHDIGPDSKLFVTSGIGETGTRARLFNPPEIVLITLE